MDRNRVKLFPVPWIENCNHLYSKELRGERSPLCHVVYQTWCHFCLNRIALLCPNAGCWGLRRPGSLLTHCQFRGAPGLQSKETADTHTDSLQINRGFHGKAPWPRNQFIWMREWPRGWGRNAVLSQSQGSASRHAIKQMLWICATQDCFIQIQLRMVILLIQNSTLTPSGCDKPSLQVQKLRKRKKRWGRRVFCRHLYQSSLQACLIPSHLFQDNK